jgi:hypothetical protein
MGVMRRPEPLAIGGGVQPHVRPSTESVTTRLEAVRRDAEKAWRYWLSRRSRKSPIDGEKFQKLLATYVLPIPKIVHNI